MTEASRLILHSGANLVPRADLAKVATPEPTATWFPVGHEEAIATVEKELYTAGFHRITGSAFALTRGGSRLFATFDLDAILAPGVRLAVGVRNSIDKSLPLGFCAGSRVFCCDNLSFSAELVVHKKHTKFGRQKFTEEISRAIASLKQFRAEEAERIGRFQEKKVSDTQAESLILRAYEQDIISHLLLGKVISQWREPTHEQFAERTLWSLFNCFTGAMADRTATNPYAHADMTMNLGHLFALAI